MLESFYPIRALYVVNVNLIGQSNVRPMGSNKYGANEALQSGSPYHVLPWWLSSHYCDHSSPFSISLLPQNHVTQNTGLWLVSTVWRRPLIGWVAWTAVGSWSWDRVTIASEVDNNTLPHFGTLRVGHCVRFNQRQQALRGHN